MLIRNWLGWICLLQRHRYQMLLLITRPQASHGNFISFIFFVFGVQRADGEGEGTSAIGPDGEVNFSNFHFFLVWSYRVSMYIFNLFKLLLYFCVFSWTFNTLINITFSITVMAPSVGCPVLHSPWMRAARWASCQSKWFRPRLEKCCRGPMPPNPASWRPGLRWIPGMEATLCFHLLDFRFFLFLSSAFGSQNYKLQLFLLRTWTRIPAFILNSPRLLSLFLLCLFSLSFLISPLCLKQPQQVWSGSAVRQWGEWLRVWGRGQWLHFDS